MRRTAQGLSWAASSATQPNVAAQRDQREQRGIERSVTSITRTPARQFAHALESSAARHSLAAQGLAYAWGRIARVERPLKLPQARFVIGVSGAALGGSGATPVAMRLAEELASRGLPVALVSHGFGARVSAAQRVAPAADGALCGDEAHLAALRLRGSGVPVFIAQRRQVALDRAARALPDGGVLILDGVLQAAPQRLSVACLVVDSSYPWGLVQCPPVGDLRAPPAALLSAADCVLSVDTGGSSDAGDFGAKPVVQVTRRATGLNQCGAAALADCPSLPLSWLRGRDFGLALALGRPGRVVSQLRALGVAPSRVYEALDHRGLSALVRSKKYSRSDVWVTTAKCWLATQAGLDPAFDGDLAGNWLLLTERLELPTDWVDGLVAALDFPAKTVCRRQTVCRSG